MSRFLSNLAQITIATALASGCAAVGEPVAPHHPFSLVSQNAQDGPVAQHAGGAARLSKPIYFDGRVTLSGGSYEHDIDNTLLGSIKDDTAATFFGLLLEGSSHAGFGGGISMEMMISENDLFESQSAPTQAFSFEFSPFFLYRVAAGNRFTMPVRLGPWIHTLSLEDQSTSDTIDWTSIGGRVEVEPEIVLAASPKFEFSLFSAFSFAAGATNVHEDVNDEDYDTSSSAFGFEIGPRFRFSHFLASVSYLHRQLSADQSDPTNNIVIFGFDNSFDGLALSFGGGF